jgi:hypothetical protein
MGSNSALLSIACWWSLLFTPSLSCSWANSAASTARCRSSTRERRAPCRVACVRTRREGERIKSCSQNPKHALASCFLLTLACKEAWFLTTVPRTQAACCATSSDACLSMASCSTRKRGKSRHDTATTAEFVSAGREGGIGGSRHQPTHGTHLQYNQPTHGDKVLRIDDGRDVELDVFQQRNLHGLIAGYQEKAYIRGLVTNRTLLATTSESSSVQFAHPCKADTDAP